MFVSRKLDPVASRLIGHECGGALFPCHVERRRRAAAGLGDAISGCIMFEETLYQDAADGKPFVDVLKAQGILPGIKVDTGEHYCLLRPECTSFMLKGQDRASFRHYITPHVRTRKVSRTPVFLIGRPATNTPDCPAGWQFGTYQLTLGSTSQLTPITLCNAGLQVLPGTDGETATQVK